MTRFLYKLSTVAVLFALLPGCPAHKQTSEAPKDLGTDGEPLMPMAGVMHDTRLVNGSADWVPFRKLEEADDQGAKETGDNAEAPGAEDTGEVEQEIRDLLEDYNELVAERDIEEIVTYHIEEHQDTVKSMYESRFNLLDQLGEVESALNEALPGEEKRIRDAFAPFRSASGGLNVTRITVKNDNLVIGELKDSVTPMCRFVRADDEWFIDVPNLPTVFAQVKPRLDMTTKKLGTVPQGLRSGQIQAEPILQQLETQLKALAGDTGTTNENIGGADKDPEKGETAAGADSD